MLASALHPSSRFHFRCSSTEWWQTAKVNGLTEKDPHIWKQYPTLIPFVQDLQNTELKSVWEYANESQKQKLRDQTVNCESVKDPSLDLEQGNATPNKGNSLSFLYIGHPFLPAFPVRGATVTVIVRPGVQNAYDLFFKSSQQTPMTKCAIIGAAGIGKSSNTLYLAWRLMQANQFFVLQRGSDYVLAFAPSRHPPQDSKKADSPEDTKKAEYTVWSTNPTDFDPRKMPSLNNGENYFIYDPQEKLGEAPWSVSAHVVSPCSPNPTHYMNLKQATDEPLWLYAPPFDFNELETCFHLDLLRNVPTLEVLRERFFYFGGSLRKITALSSSSFKGEIDTAIQKLSQEDVERLFLRTALDRAIKEEDSEPPFSSRLWSYFLGNDNTPFIAAASEYVKLAALRAHYRVAVSAVSTRTAEYGAAAASPEREELCRLALSVVKNFTVRSLNKNSTQTPGVITLPPVVKTSWCSSFADKLPDLTAVADLSKLAELTLYSSVRSNEPVLDLICAANVGFQVTGAKDGKHIIKTGPLLKILDATKVARGDSSFKLYLVVLEKQFINAQAQVFEPKPSAEQQARIDKELEQYVLQIPSTLPRVTKPSTTWENVGS